MNGYSPTNSPKAGRKKKHKASMGQWEELGRSPPMFSPSSMADPCPKAVAPTHSGTQGELGANRNEKLTD